MLFYVKCSFFIRFVNFKNWHLQIDKKTSHVYITFDYDTLFQHFVGDCPVYLNGRISHFDYHRVELCDLVKHDRIFKLASFVHKTKQLEKI